MLFYVVNAVFFLADGHGARCLLGGHRRLVVILHRFSVDLLHCSALAVVEQQTDPGRQLHRPNNQRAL